MGVVGKDEAALWTTGLASALAGGGSAIGVSIGTDEAALRSGETSALMRFDRWSADVGEDVGADDEATDIGSTKAAALVRFDDRIGLVGDVGAESLLDASAAMDSLGAFSEDAALVGDAGADEYNANGMGVSGKGAKGVGEDVGADDAATADIGASEATALEGSRVVRNASEDDTNGISSLGTSSERLGTERGGTLNKSDTVMGRGLLLTFLSPSLFNG